MAFYSNLGDSLDPKGRAHINEEKSVWSAHSSSTDLNGAVVRENTIERVLPENGRFVKRSSCSDWPWALIFVIHIIVTIVYVTYKCIEAPPNTFNYSVPRHMWVFLICIIPVILWATVWVFALKKCASYLVAVSLLSSPFILAVAGCVLFFSKRLWGISIALFFGVLIQVYYLKQIAAQASFCSMLISTASLSVQKSWGVLVMAFGCLLLILLWSFFWFLGLVAMLSTNNIGKHSKFNSSMWGFLICLFLSVYWTREVLNNTIHTAVAGVVGHWYFNLNHDLSKSTWDIFCNSTLHSFGSICVGSLLVSASKTVRTMIALLNYVLSRGYGQGQLQSQIHQYINGCLLSFLTLLEASLQWFNMYAFTHVAMYGKSYTRAVRDTARLIQSTGVDILAHYDITVGVVIFGGCVGGTLASLVALLALQYVSFSSWVILHYTLIAFILGYYGTGLVSTVIQSAVTSLFVYFAEDPNELMRIDPYLYSIFQDNLHTHSIESLELPLVEKLPPYENNSNIVYKPYTPPNISIF